MKSKTIELDLATAKRIYKPASAELKTILEKNFSKSDLSDDPKDIISTLDDVFEINGTSYEQVIPFRKPVDDDQKSTNADALIKQITKAYNAGEQLNWKNTSQPKYALYFEQSGGGWVVNDVDGYCDFADRGAGHYFKSEALARDAYSKFNAVWDDYLPR